jgi:hypothetical protein
MSHDIRENKKNTLQAILAPDDLGLENEADWDALVDHIEVHKYLINQKIGWTITWQDAVFSWYENVYRPIMNIISSVQVQWAFPGMTLGQLFFAVCTNWYYMQESDPQAAPLDAAYEYLTENGKGLGKFLSMLTMSTAG